MALRFNPPPNWPEPPQGWVPQQGWQPDPAWGPAPQNWVFWIDDSEQDGAPTVPLSDVSGTARPTTESSGQEAPPEQPSESVQAETGQPTAEAGSELTPVEPAEAEPAERGQDQAEPGTPAQDETSQISAQHSAEHSPTGQSAPATVPTEVQGAYPASAEVPGNPYSPQGETKNKKGIIAFIIAGVVLLLALIIGLVFVLGNAISSVNSISSSTSSGSADYSPYMPGNDPGNSEPNSSDSSGSAGPLVAPQNPGSANTYEGSGDSTVDITKPDGINSPAWVEIEYTASNNNYDFLSVNGMDGDGMTTEYLVDTSMRDKTFKGSVWIDARYTSSEPTHSLSVEGEGDWKITVHSVADAPVYTGEHTFKDARLEAFIVEGENKTASITTTQDFLGNLLVEIRPEDEGFFSSLFYTQLPGIQGSISLPNGKNAYQLGSYSSGWELTIK